MTPDILRHHIAYKRWQARKLLDAIRPLRAELFEAQRGSSHGGIQGTLQHIYGADLVWLRRVRGIPVTRADITMPTTFQELDQWWTELLNDWHSWACRVPDPAWDDKISYVMFDGSRGSSRLWEVVMHVVNHATLHAGQVVAMLRQAGVTPPGTDILYFYRELEAAPATA